MAFYHIIRHFWTSIMTVFQRYTFDWKMPSSKQAVQIADLLRQVEDSISNIPGNNDSKYAALGRLKDPATS